MKTNIAFIFVNLYFFVIIKSSKTPGEHFLDYYEHFIYKKINESANYVYPTDARIHEATDTSVKEYGTFDFVIIGGGVTGTLIAHRLSEIPTFNILLIEAGDFSDGGLMTIPKLYFSGLKSKYNWAYTSVPQKSSCLADTNQRCLINSGKGVGGSSLINGLIYARGAPDNYNNLANFLNDSSWNYNSMLYYFKKTESFHWTNGKAPIDPSYHNKYGLLNVQHGVPDNIWSKIFLEANRELGYYPIDYNGPNMIGSSYLQLYTRFGRREDFGSVFITPYLGRPNLKVTTDSFVTKIEINETTKVAESVLFTKNGCTYRAKASKEVILSAGTISSPKILMLSGVGLRQHLESLNISVIQNLDVGRNYREHVVLGIPFFTNMKFHRASLKPSLADLFFKGSGELSVPWVIQGVGFYQVNKRTDKTPDFELFWSLLSELYITTGDPALRDTITGNETVYIFLTYSNTKSVGSVGLKSNIPYDYPLIDPNLLGDSNMDDINGAYQAIQFILKLANTKILKDFNFKYSANFSSPCNAHQFLSRDYWICFLKQYSIPGYHEVGTCAAGTDPIKGAVVDSNLKVFGIKNLRVADASVFPKPIAGHTSIPCSAVAEKISDVIKKEYT